MASYGVYEQHGDVRNDDPSYRLAFAAGGGPAASRSSSSATRRVA
jgi:hypothetical protein